MKDKKFKIFTIISVFILIVFGFMIFNIDNFNNLINDFITNNRIKNRDKIVNNFNLDFNNTRNFSSDYLGISFIYPDTLSYEESSLGGFPYHKDYGIVSRAGNIMFYDKNRPSNDDYSYNVFQVKLYFGDFDKENLSELVECRKEDRLREDDPMIISLAKKAEAFCGVGKKITKIGEFYNNDNHYYTYSVNGLNKFFLIKDKYYISFDFFTKNEDFIKNILSSIKTFEPVRE